MMETLDELRQEPHWSYSALNTYLNICQAQFMYRYVEHAEVERTSVCFPFGRAFHAALTAQAWEGVTGGGSLTLDEMVEQFVEAFKIEVKATQNLIYKEGENYDSMVELASRMLDAVSANWSDCYTVKAVARAFKVEVPGLDCSLIGEWDCVVQDGRDICIVDWKTSASRWPAGKAERDLQATVFSYAYEKLTGTAPLFDSMWSPRRRSRVMRVTTPVGAFTTSADSRRWQAGRSMRSIKACFCRMKHRLPAENVLTGIVAGSGI